MKKILVALALFIPVATFASGSIQVSGEANLKASQVPASVTRSGVDLIALCRATKNAAATLAQSNCASLGGSVEGGCERNRTSATWLFGIQPSDTKIGGSGSSLLHQGHCSMQCGSLILAVTL